MAPHGEGAHPKGAEHRDADEEALQAALQESLEPDYLAEILQSEQAQRRASDQETQATVPLNKESAGDSGEEEEKQEEEEVAADLSAEITRVLRVSSVSDAVNEAEDDEEDPNAEHKLLNFADMLLIDILKYLDEDTIGSCVCTCKRLLLVARSELVFETLCRRIFPVQCPKVAAASARNQFALRRFPTWFDMFHDRPRVRYNGFYWLRVSYYKKPELNMWTDIVPGTILKCIYYRYFSFQRDGSVLYAMLFKPPHEAEAHLAKERKGVYRGRFHVDKDQLVVSVPTNCNLVTFQLSITQRERGKNVKLVLNDHYANSEPDGSGWVNYYDTAEEEFHYYRSWNL